MSKEFEFPPFVLLETNGNKKTYVNLFLVSEISVDENEIVLTRTAGRSFVIKHDDPSAIFIKRNLGRINQLLEPLRFAELPKMSEVARTPSPVGPQPVESQAETITDEKLQQLAQRIFSFGGVEEQNNLIKVSTKDGKGSINTDSVTWNDKKEAFCTCPRFKRESRREPAFRCEHIRAARLYVVEKNKNAGDRLHVNTGSTWRCHHLTKQSIQKLLDEIVNHPQRDKNTTPDSILAQIKFKIGDRSTLETLLQEPAEDVEKWLKNWIERLNKKSTVAA